MPLPWVGAILSRNMQITFVHSLSDTDCGQIVGLVNFADWETHCRKYLVLDTLYHSLIFRCNALLMNISEHDKDSA